MVNNKKYHQRCQFCGREWDSYKKNPLECRYCKRYLNPPPRTVYRYKKGNTALEMLGIEEK